MIRKEQGGWTKEAEDFYEDIRSILLPVFDRYKDEFSFEEIFYMTSITIDTIILDEVLGLRLHREATKADLERKE